MHVCVRGTGKISRCFSEAVEKALDIHISYYVDVDEQIIGKEVRKGVICKRVGRVNIDKIACIVLIGGEVQNKICEEMTEMGYAPVFSWKELCNSEYIEAILRNITYNNCYPLFERRANEFERIKASKSIENLAKKRIVVYTCIIGDYDSFVEPEYVSDECDYFLISDKKPSSNTIYKWIDAEEVIPKEIRDNSRRNRYCKINPHILFSDYEYSIYHDGSFVARGNLGKLLDCIGTSGIALCKHPNEPANVFEEAAIVLACKKDNADTVLSQMERYINENIPLQNQLYAGGLLVRRHNKKRCRLIMQEWWKEVFVHSYRDQLSLPYVLWKNGIAREEVGIIEGNIYNLDMFEYVGHHSSGCYNKLSTT